MESEPTFSCFGISCPCWASNCMGVTILHFDQGSPEVWLLVPPAWSAFPMIVDLINCWLHVKLTTQSSVKSQRPAPFAFQSLFYSLFCCMMDLSFVQMFCKCFTWYLQGLGFYLFVSNWWDQCFKLSSSKKTLSWWGVTEFVQPYKHMDIQSIFCQLSTSSGRVYLLSKRYAFPEVTTRDAHLRLLLPPLLTRYMIS